MYNCTQFHTVTLNNSCIINTTKKQRQHYTFDINSPFPASHAYRPGIYAI